MKAVIVAAGGVSDAVLPYVRAADLRVAADGGAAALLAWGLLPQAAVGDFDSLDEETLGRLERLGCPLMQVQPEKDETDTELAVRYALERGADWITLVGAIGSRLDHTWANLTLLARLAQEGIRAQAVSPPLTVYATVDQLTVSGRPGDIVSVFPALGGAEGVTEVGFKYALTDRTLAAGTILGVSNELRAEQGTIAVRAGVLLVFHYRQERG